MEWKRLAAFSTPKVATMVSSLLIAIAFTPR